MATDIPPSYQQMIEAGRNDKRKLVVVQMLTPSEVAEKASAATTTDPASKSRLSSKSDSRSHHPDPHRVRGFSDSNARVAVVTLNDPASLNALSITLMVQLRDAVEALCANPAVKCIVLTGTDLAFCSGGALRCVRVFVRLCFTCCFVVSQAIWS